MAVQRPPVTVPLAAATANRGAPDLAAARRPGVREVDGPVLSRQSARCLRYIAAHPGSSSTQVQAGVGIRHPSQVSNVLTRLERDGLARTDRGRRAPNAWRATERGAVVVAGLPEGIYA